MTRRRQRPPALAFGVIALAMFAGGCGSSDAAAPVTTASGSSAPAAADPIDSTPRAAMETTEPPAVATTPMADESPTTSTPVAKTAVISDAEIASIEAQLDEIDQVLAQVEHDLEAD